MKQTLKIHLKLKGRALCGTKRKKTKLQFVDDETQVTCSRCKLAIQR